MRVSLGTPVGTYVTYDDEPDPPDVWGTIVEPSADELAYGQAYEYPVGPELGYLLVDWGSDDFDRSWEHKSDLRVLEKSMLLSKGGNVASNASKDE